MTRIRRRVFHNLHHLREVDLAPLIEMFLSVFSVEGLVTWFLFLFDFQMRIYPTELMSLHSSIDQNMEQVELHIFH